MRYIILILTMTVLLLSCNRSTEYVEVLSYDVSVDNPLHFDHKSGETIILMGKVVQAKNNKGTTRYQYYIPARDGTWIETNQKFHLGDTLIMNGLQSKDITSNTSISYTKIEVSPKRDTLNRRKR